MDEGDADATAAERGAFAELAELTLAEVLQKGQENLLRRLVAKSIAGTLSHQEAAILRNLLRDNGMTMGVSPPAKVIDHRPVPALPHYDPPDYEE